MKNDVGIEIAALGIIKKGSKVMLTKRSSKIREGGKWCIPGGHIYKWESAEEAVRREIKEEINLDVKKSELLFMHEEFIKRLDEHGVIFVFLLNAGGIEKPNGEVSEIKWFSKDEMQNLEFAFTHKNILNKFWEIKR